jgi:hypothetical protein
VIESDMDLSHKHAVAALAQGVSGQGQVSMGFLSSPLKGVGKNQFGGGFGSTGTLPVRFCGIMITQRPKI